MLSHTCYRASLALAVVGFAGAAEADEAVRIRQVTLPNPVADSVVLANRAQLTPQPAGGVLVELPGLIEVRHAAPELGYAWDPVECRLLFAWKGGAMTGLILVAEGPSPLAATVGTAGVPQYFGYRLTEGGVPEFLYRLGNLAVEERIAPTPDGSQLVQRWNIRQSDYDIFLAVPERWKDLAKVSAGTWADGFYKVPKARAGDLILTWMLGQPPGLPTLPAAWTKPAGGPEPKAASASR